MFGLNKMKADIESLKIQISKLNNKIAHLENEKEAENDRITGLVEVVGKDTAEILDKVSLLDINLDSERSERRYKEGEQEKFNNHQIEERRQINQKLEKLDKHIVRLIEDFAQNAHDIFVLKKSMVKPKKKVGKPRKVKVEENPKPKKKDGQKG